MEKVKNLENSVKEKNQEVENYKNRIVKLESVVNTLETSLEQLSNSKICFNEVFQMKFNVLCSEIIRYEWIVSFDELEFGEVLSDCFYLVEMPLKKFQIRANLFNNALKIWINALSTGNYSNNYKIEDQLVVCLAGRDGKIQKEIVSLNSSSFQKYSSEYKSKGYGWDEFLKPVSEIKEKWAIDRKLHLFCIVTKGFQYC